MIETFLHSRALRRWGNAARKANFEELETLKDQRGRARQLQAKLGDLVHVAESRLALPRIGSNSFQRPGGTLWAWRPQLWRGPLREKGIAAVENKTPIGDEIVVYHDCKISELTVRQLRNTHEEDLAPFGLRMDVFKFDGSFLSLALELPKPACEGMQKRHIIRLSAIIEAEKPLEIFARLNLKHGPNTAQLVLEMPLKQDEVMVEFDFAYSDLNEKRIEKMWLDLIFEGPEMNQIVLRDLTMCRYPRAEI
jgi:hypothetical protein